MKFDGVYWRELRDNCRGTYIWLHENGVWTELSEAIVDEYLEEFVTSEYEPIEALIAKSAPMTAVAKAFKDATESARGQVTITVRRDQELDVDKLVDVYTATWEQAWK